jgi:uncharacterized repeat protein (TIGR02543 family)
LLNVTFDAQGGSSISATTVLTGASISAPASTTRSGYSFSGWFIAATGGSAITFPYSPANTSDFTLYAQWSATSQSVTYTLNGGSGTAPTQATVATGSAFTIASGSGVFRSGYTFVGWNDGSATFQAGSSYAMSASNVTLAAQWTLNATRSITYANGGGTGTAPTQASVADGLSFTVAANTFTRTGYTFTFWNDGTSNYSAGSSYTVGASNVTLTAQWSGTSQSITYALNGGSGTLPTQANVATGATFVVASGSSLTRTGFTFSGWSDGTATFQAGSAYTMGTSNVTLSAQWNTNVTHSVTYTAGSTAVTGTAPTEVAIVEGLTFVVKANTFTRTGFTFSAWLSSGSGIVAASYSAGSTFTMGLSDVVLTAQWSAIPNSTVTFNPDDAGGIEYVQTTNVATNLIPNTFTRPGFTFGGWSRTPTPNSVFAFGNNASYPFTSSITLYAIWNPGTSRTVTYALGGGTGQLPTQTPVSEGASFVLSSGETLSRVGFVLSGWSDGTNNYVPGATYTMSTLDVVLTANWTQAGSRSVVYSLNGGTGTAPTQADVVEGLTFTVAARPATRPGYTFNSWFDGTTNFLPGAIYTVARSNVALIAQWIANTSRSVTYTITDGTAASASTTGNAPAAVDVPEGATFVAADHDGFTRPGFAFSTWSDGSANYAPGATITMGANGIVLTAIWTANPTRTITYSLGGGTGTLPTQDDVAQGLTFRVAESTGLSRSGFVFSNWTNGAVFYAAGATYTASTSNITLTAVWRAVPIRTVVYSLGLGTGTVPVQAAIEEGLTFTIADETGIRRTGFTFASWTDGRTTYAPGADYKVGAFNITLTAVWSQAQTRTITYLLGQGSGIVPTETPKVSGSKFTVAEDTGITRAGFTLLGWRDGVTTYAPGDTYTMSNFNVVFNAVWTPVVARTITYANPGATGTPPIQSPVATGGSFVVAAGAGLIRVGFTFTGWSDGSKLYAPGDTYDVGAQNVLLTAQWVPTVLRTVTYLLNTGVGVTPVQASVASGTRFIVATSAGITRIGFSLSGWSDSTGTYLPGSQYTVGAANVTLTAIWVPAVARTVTYSLGGGVGPVPTQTPVAEGASFRLASAFGITRAGFRFAGWNNGTATYLAGGLYKMGATEVVLTAVWSR